MCNILNMEPNNIKYVNGIPIISVSGELLPSISGIINVNEVTENDPFLSNVMFIDPSQVIE